jgi:hypothetical protein
MHTYLDIIYIQAYEMKTHLFCKTQFSANAFFFILAEIVCRKNIRLLSNLHADVAFVKINSTEKRIKLQKLQPNS